MPNPSSPPPPTDELDRTRQQLQELDQLLEQMLALPLVERPRREPEAAPAPPPVRAPVLPTEPPLPLMPFVRRSPPSLEPLSAEPKRIVTFVPPPDQLAHVDVSLVDLPETPHLQILATEREEIPEPPVASVFVPDPMTVDVRAPDEFDLNAVNMLDLVGVPEVDTTALPSPPPPGFAHAFLLGVNGLYDRAADVFWPISPVLKWSGTRSLLGLLGILLLLGAAAWILFTSVGFLRP